MPSIAAPEKPLPVYYIGHAGVGLLFRDDPNNKIVQDNLRLVGDEIRSLNPQPKAIVVFSGHFEAGEIHGPNLIEVNVKKGTPILHDYVNDFHDSHPHVYDYDWKHTDAPELGQEIWQLLKAAGIRTKRVERGIDHGAWVPFKILFPEDNPLEIPVVLVSTYHGSNLEQQIALGETISKLRSQGYLIVGSGMAVHSFDSIGEIHQSNEEERQAVRAKVLAESKTFDAALRQAVTKQDLQERKDALLKLEELPEFKRSHPTVEHFTPLLVAAGAAGHAEVESVGINIVEPGMSYVNYRFRPL